MSNANDAGYPQGSAGSPSVPPSPPPGQSLPLAPLNPGLAPAPRPQPIGYPPYGAPVQSPPQPSAHAAPPASGYSAPPASGYPAPQAPAPQGAYSAPPAGRPAYPVPPGGYPISTAYPAYPAYGYGAPSGRRFWALQFLVYIPYVGALVTVIVSLVQRSAVRQSPFPVVRENARWAANWALSFLLYIIVCIALIVIVGVSTSSRYGDGPSGLIGIPVVLMFGIGVYCLVTMIRGCVISDRTVHHPVLALPFLRD